MCKIVLFRFFFVLFYLPWSKPSGSWSVSCNFCFSGCSSLALIATAFPVTLECLDSHCSLGQALLKPCSLKHMIIWVLTSVRYSGSSFSTSFHETLLFILDFRLSLRHNMSFSAEILIFMSNTYLKSKRFSPLTFQLACFHLPAVFTA